MAEKKVSNDPQKKKERITSVLELSDISVLDISKAKEVKERILAAVEGNKQIYIDASNVERITTPCLQILLAASMHVRKKRGRLILKASQPISDSMRLMGLNQTLEEWSN